MSSLPDVRLGGTRPEEHTPQSPGEHRDEPLAAPEDASPVPQGTSPLPQIVEVGPDEPVKLPPADLGGERMTAVARGGVVLRHWAAQTLVGIKEAAARPGGVYEAHPESFAQYRAYVQSRAWLPEGYDRGWLLWVTVAYYNTLGWAGIAAGYGIAWLFARMLRFNVAVAVTAVCITLWCIFS